MIVLALCVIAVAFASGIVIILLLISEGGGQTTNFVFDLVFFGIGGIAAVLILGLERLDKEIARRRAEDRRSAAYVASPEDAMRFHRITSQT